MSQSFGIALYAVLLSLGDAPVFDSSKSEQDTEQPTKSDAACPLTIQVVPETISGRIGEQLEVEIRIVNRSKRSVELFTGTYGGQSPMVAAVLDSRGRQLGDLLLRPSVSNRGIRRNDWSILLPGDSFSRKVRFRAGKVTSQKSGTVDLPPGHYEIELVAYDALCLRRPDLSELDRAFALQIARALDVDPSVVEIEGEKFNMQEERTRMDHREWMRAFPGREILRSNKVKLEFSP